MSGFGVHLVAVVCLIVFLSGQSSANFWQTGFVSLPSNPNNPYYQAFQNVPPASVTADKLMTNFLHLDQLSAFARLRRLIRIEDIVIVMDGSGSVRRCDFDIAKEALKNMMGLATGSQKYAAVTFSSSASVNFKFLPHSTAKNEVMKIPYPGGMTNTQAGLVEAKKLFDDPSSGRRPSASKLVFLVTDGQSNVQPHLTIPKANALKNSGALIYVVAVGTSIDGIDELVKLADHQSKLPMTKPDMFLFRVKDFSGFWKVVSLVIKKVSPSKYTVIAGQYKPLC